jgi:hypothetical protein
MEYKIFLCARLLSGLGPSLIFTWMHPIYLIKPPKSNLDAVVSSQLLANPSFVIEILGHWVWIGHTITRKNLFKHTITRKTYSSGISWHAIVLSQRPLCHIAFSGSISDSSLGGKHLSWNWMAASNINLDVAISWGCFASSSFVPGRHLGF